MIYMNQTIQINVTHFNEIKEVLKASEDEINDVEMLERIIAIVKSELNFKPISKYEELNFDIYKKEYLVDEQEQILMGLLVSSEEISVVDEDMACALDTLNAVLYKDVFLLEDGSLRVFECFYETHWVRNDWFIVRKVWNEMEDQTFDNSTVREIVKTLLQMPK